MTATRFGSTGTLEKRSHCFKFTMTDSNGFTTSRVIAHTDPNTILNDLNEYIRNPSRNDFQYDIFSTMCPEMLDMLYCMLRYDQLGNWEQLIPEYKMYDSEA